MRFFVRVSYEGRGCLLTWNSKASANGFQKWKQHKNANGFWTVGRPPFGYQVNEEERLEPNPEQAEALAADHRWKAEGYSLWKISDQ